MPVSGGGGRILHVIAQCVRIDSHRCIEWHENFFECHWTEAVQSSVSLRYLRIPG